MSTVEKTPAQVLREAADLIEPKGAWTQGYYARREDQSYTEVKADDAVCWCVRGAISRASGISTDMPDETPFLLAPVTGSYGLVSWNDAPGRTQGEVVAALREAADRAEAKS